MLWRVWQFFRHQFYRKHRKGHGIHSPYLFAMVYEVVFNAGKSKVPAEIISAYQDLSRDETLIPAGSFGAGSTLYTSAKRTVRSFVRASSVHPKYGALLFRIAAWHKPELILELGTGLGLSTLYLAFGSKGIPVQTFEGNRERAAYAAQLFNRLQLDGVSIHWGELESQLEEVLLSSGQKKMLVFLDANHRYEPTLRYMRSILDHSGEEAVIILDDIYWSRDMYRAWQEIISWPESQVSIDLFHMGILLHRKDLQRAHLKIKF